MMGKRSTSHMLGVIATTVGTSIGAAASPTLPPTLSPTAYSENQELGLNYIVYIAIGVAAVVVLGVILLIRKCCRRPKLTAMADQILKPIDVDSPRPRFTYVEYDLEQKLSPTKKTPPKLDRTFSTRSTSSTDGGYMDVDGKVVTKQVWETSPTKNRTSVHDSFGSLTVISAPTQMRFRVPSMTDVDFEEAGFGFDGDGKSDMEAVSRTNPSFDMDAMAAVFGESVDVELEIDDEESLDDETEFKGFDLEVDPTTDATDTDTTTTNTTTTTTTPTPTNADEEYGFDTAINDATAPPPDEEFGFGGMDEEPPHSLLPQHSVDELNRSLDILNTRSTSIEERLSGTQTLLEVMKLEGGVDEVRDSNGVVSFVSVFKEETDPQLQQDTLRALNILCGSAEGLTEAVQNGIVFIWMGALEAEELWREVIQGMLLALDDERAVSTLVGENAIAKLCDRLAISKSDTDTKTLFEILCALCARASRYTLVSSVVGTLAIVIRRFPDLHEQVLEVVQNLVVNHKELVHKDAITTGFLDMIQGLEENQSRDKLIELLE